MMQGIKPTGVWTARVYPGDATGGAKQIYVENKALSFEFTVGIENILWVRCISV